MGKLSGSFTTQCVCVCEFVGLSVVNIKTSKPSRIGQNDQSNKSRMAPLVPGNKNVDTIYMEWL